jgi:Undecaprenyl-phosphate glucose phosphotransferase
MADADHIIAADAPAPGSLRRSAVVHRLLICTMVAAIEGVAALLTVFLVALAYHALVLHETMFEFDTLFYLVYGAATGVIYAGFAALACSRMLDRSIVVPLDVQHAFTGWTATIALTLLIAFLVGRIGDVSRVSLTSAYLVGIPLLFGVRSAIRSVIEGRINRGTLHFETIAVIGHRLDVVNFLVGGELWRQGHKLADTLYFEEARDEAGRLRADIVSDFAARNLKRGTDHIVLVGSLAELDELDAVTSELRRYALNLLYAPASRNRALKFLDVVAIGPNNVLRFVRKPLSNSAVLVKRAMDVTLAGLGLLVLSPLLALVALAIMLDSPGPLIYRQERRGFNGEIFLIWKFRSMHVTESGYQMTQARPDDPRITRVGRFIRATSIDELPQLVNVLTGQMSLVGPRPHAISHDEALSRQLAVYAHRQRIKPGITGWAQVHGYRGETASREQIEGRVAHDIYYIDHWSILLDLWTLMLTVFSPHTRRNAR